MANSERKRTTAHLLLLAVVAMVMVSQSAALPIRITRQVPGSPVDVGNVQLNLKRSINALTLIIQPFTPMVNACRLWENVTATVRLTEGDTASNNSSSNHTATETETHLRNITCHKISEETTGFDLILEDGSCSETTLDYLCDRQLQKIESYSLFEMIDVNMVGFVEWVQENFDEALADHLRELYK